MKGFTLIELLIVLLIISILGGISLVLFQDVQKTARDGKRKQDIRSIQLALEAYYNQNDRYPCSSRDVSDDVTVEDWNVSTQPNPWIIDDCTPGILFNQNYISELPKDPKNEGNALPWASKDTYTYAYLSIPFPKPGSGEADGFSGCPKGDGQYYILITRLETSDAEVNRPEDVKFCTGDSVIASGMLPILETDDVDRLLILTSQE